MAADDPKKKPTAAPPPVPDFDKSAGIGVSDDELSDEGLDSLIGEEDPEFLEELKKLAAEKNLSIADIDMGEIDEALLAERERWQSGPRLMRVAAAWMPFLPSLSLGTRRVSGFARVLVSVSGSKLKKLLVYLVTAGKDQLIVKAKAGFEVINHWREQQRTRYDKLTFQKKAVLFGLIALAGVIITFATTMSKHKLIKKDAPLFLSNFEGVADRVFTFEPKSDEPFYENLRIGSHMLLIPKMVVNIKKSANSGENPMAAFEFFIEGYSQEVVIELKDREHEFRDDMQRAIEEFTFDQLDSAAGKQLLQETLRLNINRKLSTGRVKRILIKTLVIKD